MGTESAIVRRVNQGDPEWKQLLKLNPPPKSKAPSPQLGAIRALFPGQGIEIIHGALKCVRNDKDNGRDCSIQQIMSKEKRRRHLALISRHLPNGNVFVACLAPENKTDL